MAIGYNESLKGQTTQQKVAQIIKRHVPNLSQNIVDQLALKYVLTNKPIDRFKIEEFVAQQGY